MKVTRGDRTANGKSILDLTTLGAACGTDVVIEADGPDAELALEALVGLVSRGFDEPDLKTTLYTPSCDVPAPSPAQPAPVAADGEVNGETVESAMGRVVLRRAAPPIDAAGHIAAVSQSVAGSTIGAPVLIVEDDDDTAETMARLLRMCGHSVHVARDGHQAIELALRQRPYFVLLDLGLPGLDGYEVAARLRRELSGPFTIIAVTGYGQEEDRRRAREAGINFHLLKPADPSAVLSLLTPPMAG